MRRIMSECLKNVHGIVPKKTMVEIRMNDFLDILDSIHYMWQEIEKSSSTNDVVFLFLLFICIFISKLISIPIFIFIFIFTHDRSGNSHAQDGDIRLGTLLIPISNLPLEDEVPTVEKWFQFDSVTAGNKVCLC